MKNILIIGCGRLGSSLYRLLKTRQEYRVGVYDSAGFRKQDKIHLAAKDFHSELTPDIIRRAEFIIISVPDDHISDAAGSLLQFNLNEKFICHTSGLHSSATIQFLEEKGAYTGSLHPVQTFSSRFSDPDIWKDIWCTFEGSNQVASFLEIICTKAGARFLRVSAVQKKALHIAAVFAANYSAALYAASEKILTANHLDKQFILPLIQQMQENFVRKPAYETLSGPLQRGDSETITTHLEFLSENRFIAEEKIYRDLAEYILSDSGFNVQDREELQKVLKQK